MNPHAGDGYLRSTVSPFFRWWVSSNGATSTAKPWVSTLKWSNDWDDLGYPYFRTPPYVMIVLRSKSLQVSFWDTWISVASCTGRNEAWNHGCSWLRPCSIVTVDGPAKSESPVGTWLCVPAKPCKLEGDAYWCRISSRVCWDFLRHFVIEMSAVFKPSKWEISWHLWDLCLFFPAVEGASRATWVPTVLCFACTSHENCKKCRADFLQKSFKRC